MRADPDVKLGGFGASGRPRLSIRFRSVDPLLRVYKQVRDTGVFSVDVAEHQPTTLQLHVLFRTRRRGEEFPATILTWSRGKAVLQPNIGLADFKELTGSLVVNLSAELDRPKGAVSKPPPETPSEPVEARAPRDKTLDTLNDLQRAGERLRAAGDTDVNTPIAVSKARRVSTPPRGHQVPGAGTSPDDKPQRQDPRTTPRDGARPRPPMTPAEGIPVRPHAEDGSRERMAVKEPVVEAVASAPDPWLTSTGSFARLPSGILKTASGHFEQVPSAGVPREAYRFLDSLDLGQRALLRGEGAGAEVLGAVLDVDPTPPHCVLIARGGDDTRTWYLFYQGTTLLTGYLLPASAVTALPTLLSRQGLIPTDDAVRAFRHAAIHGMPEEAALAESTSVATDLLRKALTAKVKLLVTLLRSERQVSFEVWPLSTPLALPGLVEVQTEQSRYRERLAHYNQQPLGETIEAIESQLGTYPTLKVAVEEASTTLGLDKATRHFAAKCLTGSHPLRMLPQVSTLSRQETYAVTFALVDIEYVELLERDNAELQYQRVAARVVQQHERIGAVHDFDFLSVHWSASEREIMAAARTVEAEFSGPGTADLTESLQTMCHEIVAEVRRIREALATLEVRRAYRNEILDPFAVDQAVELLLSNFDMSVYRQDIPELNRILSRLRELDPAAALKARARLPKRK